MQRRIFMSAVSAAALGATVAMMREAKASPQTAAHQGESMTEAIKKAPHDTIFAQGELNPYGKYFTGTTYLTMLSTGGDEFNCPIGNVTFEPGARTNWHKHSGGQILLVLAGEGRYCEKGGAVRTICKGDVVRIAPNVEHWHGAAPGAWMTHVSIETNAQTNRTTWLEPVTDAQYR